ncbi:MAG: DMT family transporter [Bacteroidales bacterium]|nr:DMT family transporter [Bacteroidales bacterium]
MKRISLPRQLVGHLACFGAYAIFGFNIIFCKDISNQSILSPEVLFAFRAIGAGVLFWLLGLFTPRVHVPARDLLAMFGAGFIGLVMPQMTFLYAVGMTTPVDLSVVNSITPIMTMFVAAIFLKEPITWQKAGGVVVSFAGVVWLILQSAHASGVQKSSPLGIALTILNAFCFALYLGVCRPIIQRYDVITLMKWMFLFALLIILPFSVRGILHTHYSEVSTQVWLEVAYLIFFATFVAYFLIPLGQQRIRPTLVSMYNYLQPIIACVVGVALGMDRLTATKVLSAALIIAGVAIVNRSRAKEG